MFLRSNFDKLRGAIDAYSTTTEGKSKPGLKQNQLYLLKRSAKALKTILLSNSKDEKPQK